MNSDNSQDTLVTFDAQYAGTDAYATEEIDAGSTPARSYDMFEGGLGI